MGAAQGPPKIVILRDAETENTIRYFAKPLFTAAGLELTSLQIHLVQDDRLNAFVAGGQRLFINTGLLRKADTASAVIGVIAHEAGHIAGGHLARMDENMRNASAEAIIAMVLGAAAAVASGNPDAVVAGATLGQSVAERSFLHYSREMESSADQAALTYLDKSGQSARGLLSILDSLKGQEMLAGSQQDPYLRTHPLSQERIDVIRNHLAKSSFSDAPTPTNTELLFRRMRGKLNGYIDPPERTLTRYPADSQDIEARYARIQALRKLHRTGEALAIIDQLLALSPADPFFHETKGDVLVDGQRGAEAIQAYRRAVELYPTSALLRISLAQTLLEIDEAANATEALENLNQATVQEHAIPRAWRLKATAYGRLGDMGGVALSLAEEAMLLGDRMTAERQVKRALDLIPEAGPRRQQALDIQNRLAQLKPPGG